MARKTQMEKVLEAEGHAPVLLLFLTELSHVKGSWKAAAEALHSRWRISKQSVGYWFWDDSLPWSVKHYLKERWRLEAHELVECYGRGVGYGLSSTGREVLRQLRLEALGNE